MWVWNGEELLYQDSPGVTGDTIRGATLAPNEKDDPSTMDTGNRFRPTGGKGKKKRKGAAGKPLPF